MDNKQSDNPFDNMLPEPPDPKEIERLKAEADRQNYLVHRVFAQNQDGAELLEIWKKDLMLRPTIDAGQESPYQIGIVEGGKTMIRNILLTIERIENE